MILHPEDNRGGGRINTTCEDFQPLPQYDQTTTSNQTYINVTTTRTNSDGSTTQSFQIIAKR